MPAQNVIKAFDVFKSVILVIQGQTFHGGVPWEKLDIWHAKIRMRTYRPDKIDVGCAYDSYAPSSRHGIIICQQDAIFCRLADGMDFATLFILVILLRTPSCTNSQRYHADSNRAVPRFDLNRQHCTDL